MKKYIRLMRIKHWVKNLLIFFPIIFSGNFSWNIQDISIYILGFLAFSLVCSIVYIINDIVDAPKDRLHEEKKKRPIASGEVKNSNAIILSVVLSILILLIIMFLIKQDFKNIYVYLITYLVINLAYTFKLKKYPIIDVSIIVIGFLIRTVYGGRLANVDISNWLYLTVLSMAFYLALGKRKSELVNSSNKTREVLKLYTKEFCDKNMNIFLGLTITFYALWATDIVTIAAIGNNLLAFTVPLVIIICMKYSLNLEYGKTGDPIEVLFKDKVLMSLVMFYMFIILYIYL